MRFGLIGDTPYSHWERQQLPDMLAAMDAERLEFIIHVGDIKSGSARCDDAAYADIKAMFDASSTPVIYLPGDNEWTDCHRRSNGGYEPLERLAHLRRVFYPDEHSLGRRRIALTRQANYPENVRWQIAGLTAVGLNITGSDNNYQGPGLNAASREFHERDEANTRWLSEAFAAAREAGSHGILIAMQANPRFERDGDSRRNAGYQRFLHQLRDETRRFAGHVVLAHGDTHRQRIDHPLKELDGKAFANFTRVETYGSPFMGWVLGEFALPPERAPQFHTQPWPPQ